MPGPAPTPSSINRRRGNPGKRAINRHEPQFPPSEGTPPPWLGKHAREFWCEQAPVFLKAGTLDRGSEAGFALLAEQWGIYRSRKGVAKQSALKALRWLLPEFGFLPGSRTRLHVDLGQADDDRNPLDQLRATVTRLRPA